MPLNGTHDIPPHVLNTPTIQYEMKMPMNTVRNEDANECSMK